MSLQCDITINGLSMIRVINLFLNVSRAIHSLVLLVIVVGLVGCSHQPNRLTLADLKSRYWQGTYYLSVSQSPTSIKCSVSDKYQTRQDVPVWYQGKDANLLFTRDEDLSKIDALRSQCFLKSKQLFD